jgi:hypothetical protein
MLAAAPAASGVGVRQSAGCIGVYPADADPVWPIAEKKPYEFVYGQFSRPSPQYSEVFVRWLVGQHKKTRVSLKTREIAFGRSRRMKSSL